MKTLLMRIFLFDFFSITIFKCEKIEIPTIVNITQIFYEQREVNIKHGFSLSLNESFLTRSLCLKLKIPPEASHVILITQTVIQTKDLYPSHCNPFVTILLSKSSNEDDTYKDLFEYNFKEKFNEVQLKVVEIMPKDEFFIRYFHNENCSRSNHVILATGIFGFYLNVMNKCSDSNRIRIDLPNLNLIEPICIDMFQDENIFDRLKSINATIVLRETESASWKISITIVLLVAFVMVPLLIFRNKLRGSGIKYPLHSACTDGDLTEVVRQIEAVADVNLQEISSQKSPLHFAAIQGDVDVVTELLEAGADPNAKDKRQRNALHFACQNENTNVIDKLIKAGADVNSKDDNGKTPLYYASSDCPEAVNLLIEGGAIRENKWEDRPVFI